MRTETVEKFVKQSIVYSYVITQPFLFSNQMPSTMNTNPTEQLNINKYHDSQKIDRYFINNTTNHYTPKMTYALVNAPTKPRYQSSHQIGITGKVSNSIDEQVKDNLKEADFNEIEVEINKISYGEKNKNVVKVQKVLLYYGYYKGKIDGIYGPLTQEALMKAKEERLLSKEVKITTIDQQPAKIHDDTSKIKQTTEIKTNKQVNVIQTAKNLIGSPYVWGGTKPSGFDCSGFIQYVYQSKSIRLPRTVREIWNFTIPIDKASIGDLVFFETYQSGPSHLGIYLGNGNFIHAGSSSGVTISNLHDNSYWSSRYIGAKRIGG